MSVREAKAGDLIRALIPNGRPAWGDRYAAELDRRERELLDRVAKLESRFPVPVEREQEAKLPRVRASDQCCARKQSGNHADAVRYCCLAAGHTGRHETVYRESFDGDYLPPLEARRAHCDEDDCTCNYCRPSRDAFVSDDKARAESTGKDAVANACGRGGHVFLDAIRCVCGERENIHFSGTTSAPAAPTDEWVTIGELECGAVFETRDGIRAVKSEYRYSNAPHAQCLCVLVASGEYAHFDLRNEEPVRELRILAADEIAVRIDDATVDLIVAFMCPGYVSKLSEAVREDYKFTARCILEALSKRGGGK